MSRNSEMVTTGPVSIQTHVNGSGPAVVLIPSYGRDGGDDFEPLTAALVGAATACYDRSGAASAGPPPPARSSTTSAL